MKIYRQLTANLGQKLWMTGWLALFGFTFLMVVLAVLIKVLHPEAASACISYGRAHPAFAMLWGAGFIIYFCFMVLLCREVIKGAYRLWHQ